MRYLSLMLLTPWLLVLTWAYWAYPKTLPRFAARRILDVIAICTATLVSVASALRAFDSIPIKKAGALGVESGSIWKQVSPALYGYATFVAVLIIAMLMRHALFAARKSPREKTGISKQ